MKFIVIEMQEGGRALSGEYSTKEEVVEYLSAKHGWWLVASIELEAAKPKPGFVMNYPSGWIFCVNNSEVIS